MALGCLCLSSAAQGAAHAAVIGGAGGGPPYITDDPEPVDYLHFEAYVASIYSHGPNGVNYTAPHFEFNYGAAPNVQLHVIAPMDYNLPGGGRSAYGYGDTEFGVKYRFVQETASRPMIGIFPLIEAPSGDASRGLGNGQTQFFLPMWIQKTFGAWQTYGGGGYWHNPGTGNRDYWFVGWQAQDQVTKALALGGEIFHTTPSTVTDRDHTAFNVGAVYDFDEGHHLLLSVGKDIQGTNAGMGYMAYQWTFGPHEKAAAKPPGG